MRGFARQRNDLREVTHLFQELEELLESGVLPAPTKWERLRNLPAPWGSLSHESVTDLRARGAALVPTLKRLRELAQSHAQSLVEAKSRSSQASAQAFVSALLVPVFSIVLYELLPGVASRPWRWALCTSFALGLAGIGSFWLLAMSEQARWGGLKGSRKNWGLAAQAAGERFLALVRSGNPPDIAWVRVQDSLRTDAPDLAWYWGSSVYQTPEGEHDSGAASGAGGGAARVIIQSGTSIRRAIQVSLMEGRPCVERVETVLQGLRVELRGAVERELALLATRALKPLFICLAPSLLGLLLGGLWFSWQESFG